jgi:hypothetical protein
MSRAHDLTGQTLGKLFVVQRIERIGGKAAWRCRCECGALVDLPVFVLHGRRRHPNLACPDCGGPKPRPSRSIRCEVCGSNFQGKGKAKLCSNECRRVIRRRRELGVDQIIRTCVTCGREFTGAYSAQNVCSAECRREKQRLIALKSWRRRVARSPGLMATMRRRKREKAAADPAYAEKMRQWDRARYQKRRARMKSDPVFAAAHRQRVAEYWIKNRVRIIAERRVRLDALSPEDLAKWCERAKIACRNHRRRERAGMSPDQRDYARDKQREYMRQKRRLEIYLELQRIGAIDDDRNQQSAD